MASEGKHERKRPKGTPLLFVLMSITVIPAVLLGDAWGAGSAGIIGGLTGLFSLVVLMGGPLHADLRIAAVMAPLLVFAAVVPRLVAEASRPGAIALVVLLGFVAALLPLLGPRFANAGMGLGMTTVFGYGYVPVGGADHQQVIAAAVAGVVVALALRILMGVGDPSKPTREQVADVLVADDPGAATSTAFGTWLSDGRPRWLADVLNASSRYRLILHNADRLGTANPDDAAALRDRAKELADRVKAKPGKKPRKGKGKPDASAPDAQTTPQRFIPDDSPLAEASHALDSVEQAIQRRDTTAVQLEHDRRNELKDALLHPSARLRSVQLRHAFRTALGLLLMLLVTSGLDRGNPLVSTVMMTTFGILQASWRDTLTKARNKIIGLVGGSLAVVVILLTVPSRYLIAIATISLILGLWYIVTRPGLGNAFMVVVSVGFNAVDRDLDASTLLVQYVWLSASAVVIGLVVGFAVVPAFRAPPLRKRIESATEATAAVLRDPPDHSVSDHLALRRDAAQKLEELVPDHDELDDVQLSQLDSLRTGLRDLTALADAANLDPATLDQVLQALNPAKGSDADSYARPTLSGSSQVATSTVLDLAQQAGQAERNLLRTLPTNV